VSRDQDGLLPFVELRPAPKDLAYAELVQEHQAELFRRTGVPASALTGGQASDSRAELQALRERDPSLRERIWAWIRSAPKDATIGDGARHFGLTAAGFIAARDATG
jgi:hypothetical protein